MVHVTEVPAPGFVRDDLPFKSKAPAPLGVEELRSGLDLGGEPRRLNVSL